MIDRITSLIKMQIPERNRGLLFASGTTVPTGDGYQTGCTFQKTDGGGGTSFYINEGSVTVADFKAVEAGDYGAFASGGSTDGSILLSATNTSALAIFGGLAADPGSGTNARSFRSRFIINTGGNVEAETYGIQGQLVVKSSNLGHWHGGVMGTIECQTALSVYNPLAGVGALVGRIGGSTITVDSSCYLAGVIALASAVGVSNSGVYAGLYVTKTSGASNFSHGVYIENSDIGISLSVVTQASSMTVTALPNDARGSRFLYTCATPAMADGYGAHEIDLTVSGTATAKIAATSTWVNLAGTATVAPGDYTMVHSDGIWDGGATLTSAYIAWAKYQCLLVSNPAWCSLWELNFSGANSEVDSLFNVNNAELALGYQAGTPTKVAVGSIPFCSTAGGVLRYIYLYDAPDSD